jgi:hypothetical protein
MPGFFMFYGLRPFFVETVHAPSLQRTGIFIKPSPTTII